jgi:hypothetical protein
MLFVSIGKAKEASTMKQRIARRMNESRNARTASSRVARPSVLMNARRWIVRHIDLAQLYADTTALRRIRR